jgi:hypothetical protein
MAGLISPRTAPGHSLSVHSLPPARQQPSSKLAVRFGNQVLRSAKLCQTRSLAAAALEVSKGGASVGLANRQPSKGSRSHC